MNSVTSATMANDGTPLKLSWEDVVKKFDNLIKFAARQRAEKYRLDSMVSPQDLYQEGLIKLYDCWVTWCLGKNKDMEEFGAIFKVSLFRCIQQKAKVKAICSDIDDLPETSGSLRYDDVDVVEFLHSKKWVGSLFSSLSPIGQALLSELMSPSPTTLYHVWADIRRKEMLKSQGHRVNIPKDNTVRMKHIIRTIGITQKQYDIAMLEIREQARAFMNL